MFFENLARAFPLLLLGLLAALAYWLDGATAQTSTARKPAPREPDLRVDGFSAIGFGKDGLPLYRLVAKDLIHYPDGDTADLTAATLIRTAPGVPDLTVRGNKAHISAKGDEIFFEQDVTLHRAATPLSPMLTAQTTQLWVDTQKGLARSNQPAVAWNNTQRVQAIGFDYNHEEALLNMHAKVIVDYVQTKR